MFSGGFGSNTTGTGVFSNNTSGGLFGNSKPSLFDTKTTQSSTGLFGQSATTSNGTGLFGQTQQPKSLFGNSTQQTNLFGSTQSNTNSLTSGGLFGTQPQQQKSLFGTSTGFNTSAPVGTTIKFEPITGNDTMFKNNEQKNIITKNMCITAMPQYESKSLEELRIEDYLANRKTKQVTGGSFFGQTTQTPAASDNLFGNFQNKTTGGLFSTGTSTQNVFSNNNNTFSSGFGGIKPAVNNQTNTSGLFSPAKPSIFSSTNTSQPSTGLFGQISSVSSAGNTLLGQNQQKSLFSGTQQQTNLFGNIQSSTPASGISLFNNNQQQTQGSAFGLNSTNNTGNKLFNNVGTFGNTSGGIFGAQKPAQPLFSGTQPAQQTSLFNTGATGQTNSLFGNQLQKPTQSLFNSTLNQPTNTFGLGIGTQQFGGTNNFGLGTNATINTVNTTNANTNGINQIIMSSRTQQEIIDAQLAVLPYGDSLLLKNKSQKSKDDETTGIQAETNTLGTIGLQRKLKFLSSKLDSPNLSEKSLNTPNGKNGSILSINSPNRLSLIGSEINTSGLINGSFSYKPLISLPSVGFGAALGLNSSSNYFNSLSSQSLKNRSFLTQNSQELDRNGSEISDSIINSPHRKFTGRKAKTLDLNVLHKTNSSDQSWIPVLQPEKNINNSGSELDTPMVRKDKLLTNSTDDEIIVPKLNIDSADNTSLTTNNPNSTPKETPNTLNKSTSSLISSPVNKSTSHSPNNLDSNNLNRTEYYCEPPLEILKQFKLPNEDAYRIETGLTIGRRGYGSVFWRGPFTIHNLNFDKIVHFRNKEIIVYPDEKNKAPVGEELNRPAEVSLERVWPVQNGKIIKDLDAIIRLGFREKLERLCEKMSTEFKDYQPATGTWQFQVSHFSKYGFDSENNESVEMNENNTENFLIDMKSLQFLKRPFTEKNFMFDNTDVKRKVPLLIERPVVNVFKGLNSNALLKSIYSQFSVHLAPESCNSRRSCRVCFGPNKTFTSQPISGEYSTTINISQIKTIMCVEEYLKNYLIQNERIHELNDFKNSELFRWDPPSTLLKLIDSFIIKIANKKNFDGDAIIFELCDALFFSSTNREYKQRILFGAWLRKTLIEFNKNLFSDECSTDIFEKLYKLLLNGATHKAVEVARNSHLYNMSMLISLYINPPGIKIQAFVSEQLKMHRKLNSKTTNIYYEKILELLSGNWMPLSSINSQGDVDQVTLWMQHLGIIIWYFAKPSTTLNECIQLYEEDLKKIKF